MSVVALPRREPPARGTGAARVRRAPGRGWWRLWADRSTVTKVGTIAVVAIVVVLLGNAYATERQIQIHQLQTELLQAQAHYATQRAALTDSTAPARIALQAGREHLVPAVATLIPAVPLNVPLPLPTLNAPYTAITRQYR